MANELPSDSGIDLPVYEAVAQQIDVEDQLQQPDPPLYSDAVDPALMANFLATQHWRSGTTDDDLEAGGEGLKYTVTPHVVADFRPATEDGVFVGTPIAPPAATYGVGNIPVAHTAINYLAGPSGRPELVPSSQVPPGSGYGGAVLGVPMRAPGLAEEGDAWDDHWFSWLDPVIEPDLLPRNYTQSERSRLMGGVVNLMEERGYPDYCCSAWLSALLCFWPIGICAVFLSIQTAEANSTGDRRTARRYSRMTFLFTMISIALGVFFYFSVGGEDNGYGGFVGGRR